MLQPSSGHLARAEHCGNFLRVAATPQNRGHDCAATKFRTPRKSGALRQLPARGEHVADPLLSKSQQSCHHDGRIGVEVKDSTIDETQDSERSIARPAHCQGDEQCLRNGVEGDDRHASR